jgi:hypothetical protein
MAKDGTIKQHSDNRADEYFKAYAELSRTLRTWLVAYGIGAPIALLTNEAFAEAIRKSGQSKYIAGAFLAGVAGQVVLATVNKVSMWALYYGETQAKFKETTRYCAAHWLSERYWLDLLLDLGALAAFVWASWSAFRIAI